MVLCAHVQQRRRGAARGGAAERRAQQLPRQAPAAVRGVHGEAQQVEPGKSKAAQRLQLVEYMKVLWLEKSESLF